MIRILLFLLFTVSSRILFAHAFIDTTDQNSSDPSDPTFLSEPVHHAVHGALLLKSGSFGPAQKVNLLIGGEIAWVLNKKHLLGFSVTGLSTDVKAPRVFPVGGLNLVCNYAGVTIGYIYNSRSMIHVEGQMLIGAGQAFYRDEEYRANYDDNDIFLVFEPCINAVLNMTSSLRMTAGLSYRIASRIDLVGLESKDISGLSLNFGFKIGRF